MVITCVYSFSLVLLEQKQSKTPQGCRTQTNCRLNQNQNQSEVVTYTAVNNWFPNGGFCVFRGAFFPWGGGQGGGVSSEEFGVDKGVGGGGLM